MAINHSKAKNMLINACQNYIEHNDEQMKEISPDFFGRVKNLQSWLIGRVLKLSLTGKLNKMYNQGELNFPKEISQKHYIGALERYHNKGDTYLVLYNFQALIGILNCILEEDVYKRESKLDLDKLKKEHGYNPDDYSCMPDEPVSLQIEKTINKFTALLGFVNKLPGYRGSQFVGISGEKYLIEHEAPLRDMILQMNKEHSTYSEFLKGLAVKELKAILDNPDLSDKQAVDAFETRLHQGRTLEILSKNLQTENEKNLKFYSLVGIIFGIGIFTTLGLVAKRFYDSGGTSINFFKSLGENLVEDMESITASVSKSI